MRFTSQFSICGQGLE